MNYYNRGIPLKKILGVNRRELNEMMRNAPKGKVPTVTIKKGNDEYVYKAIGWKGEVNG